MLIGVPLSIGAALAIVERLPKRLAAGVGVFLELLAGIPSVVIGLWGVVTFGPFLARDIVPFVSRNLPDVPVLNYFKGAHQRPGPEHADLRPDPGHHDHPDRGLHRARPDPAGADPAP